LPAAHLYIFSDASPDDWLIDGADERWHTIVNLIVQSDPARIQDVQRGISHEELLPQDSSYNTTINSITSGLPSATLRKWKTSSKYKDKFCSAFAASLTNVKPVISACSFQENILRKSKPALIASYNRYIGGIEGRGIGFEESTDEKGRRQLKHSFLDWRTGYHEIKGLENQILVLLFMAWLIADQYRFFYRELVSSGRYGFDELRLTVASDKLSGDDDLHRGSEQNLRNLIDPENDGTQIVLTRSRVSDQFSGDRLTDNRAGWLTAAMKDTNGSFAERACKLAPTGVWDGWHQLQSSTTTLISRPAIESFCNHKQA
jgi:hypothetical protein